MAPAPRPPMMTSSFIPISRINLSPPPIPSDLIQSSGCVCVAVWYDMEEDGRITDFVRVDRDCAGLVSAVDWTRCRMLSSTELTCILLRIFIEFVSGQESHANGPSLEVRSIGSNYEFTSQLHNRCRHLVGIAVRIPNRISLHSSPRRRRMASVFLRHRPRQ